MCGEHDIYIISIRRGGERVFEVFFFLNAGQRVSASAHAWAPGLIKRRHYTASV